MDGGFFGAGGALESSAGCDFLAGFVSLAAGGFISSVAAGCFISSVDVWRFISFGGWSPSAFPNPGPVAQPGRESANTHDSMKTALHALLIAPAFSQRRRI